MSNVQPTIQEKVSNNLLGGQANVRDMDSAETKEREAIVTNRVVVVPCRARGMSMDHNFEVGKVSFLE